MGICCTRNETTNDEILNSFNRNEPDFSDSTRGPELSFESKRYDNNKLNNQLNILSYGIYLFFIRIIIQLLSI